MKGGISFYTLSQRWAESTLTWSEAATGMHRACCLAGTRRWAELALGQASSRWVSHHRSSANPLCHSESSIIRHASAQCGLGGRKKGRMGETEQNGDPNGCGGSHCSGEKGRLRRLLLF